MQAYSRWDIEEAQQRLTNGSADVIPLEVVAEAFLVRAAVLYAYLTR